MAIILLYLTFVFFFVTRHQRGASCVDVQAREATRQRRGDADDGDNDIGSRSTLAYEDICLTGAHHGVYDGPADDMFAYE